MINILRWNPWKLAVVLWLLTSFVGSVVLAFISPVQPQSNLEDAYKAGSPTPWVCMYGDALEPRDGRCGSIEYAFNQLRPVRIILWYFFLFGAPLFLKDLVGNPIPDLIFITFLSPYLFIPVAWLPIKFLQTRYLKEVLKKR